MNDEWLIADRLIFNNLQSFVTIENHFHAIRRDVSAYAQIGCYVFLLVCFVILIEFARLPSARCENKK